MRGIERPTQQCEKRPKDGDEGDECPFILWSGFFDQSLGFHGIEEVDSGECALLGRADECFACVPRHRITKPRIHGIHLQKIRIMRIWNEKRKRDSRLLVSFVS